MLVLILCTSTISMASEHFIVSNKKINNLSQTQIKAIFLKKLIHLNNVKLIPLNLEPNDPLRVSFEKNILQMNFTRLKSYWSSQHYLGKRPPLRLKSQESIKAFVKKVDGAIAYIDENNIDNGLHILYKWKD